MHVWNARKRKDFLHCRAHSVSDLKSDCSHSLACSLPNSLLCSFNSSFPPPSFFLPFPAFLFLYFLPPSSFFLCSISFFSPFPSFPWISSSLCFFPLPFSYPFLFSFLCISLSLPQISTPLYFFFPSLLPYFVPSIVDFWTKNLPSPRLCKAFSQAGKQH